jgi:hypothetical protein
MSYLIMTFRKFVTLILSIIGNRINKLGKYPYNKKK